jgi:hypothetical protein
VQAIDIAGSSEIGPSQAFGGPLAAFPERGNVVFVSSFEPWSGCKESSASSAFGPIPARHVLLPKSGPVAWWFDPFGHSILQNPWPRAWIG